MKIDDAQALIAGAVPRRAGVWADLGAGDGTFTQALARLLEPGSRIYAVDRDRAALASLENSRLHGVAVIAVEADLTRGVMLPGVVPATLDGVLIANTLHFISQPATLLTEVTGWLRPGGTLVIIEYDGRRPNRWVPYPLPSTALPELVRSVGFAAPTITARRPSRYGGTLYVAVAERP